MDARIKHVVEVLSVEIAEIMDSVSPVLAQAWPGRDANQSVAQIQAAGQDVVDLAAAIGVLVRRGTLRGDRDA